MISTLLEAIEQRKSLRVRYFGGSSPGSERELQPISIQDGRLRARCLTSRATKTFVVAKMELVTEGIPSQLAETLPKASIVYSSVGEFLAHQASVLQEMGWVFQRDGESLSLHRTFKNGKVIQTPDVALEYVAVTSDLVFDGETVHEENVRDRKRPWIVRAKKQTTKTYADFAKAQIQFIEFAKAMAPVGSTGYAPLDQDTWCRAAGGDGGACRGKSSS